jgi:hypothetical protein
MNTCHKGGQQTEKSVLSLWRVSTSCCTTITDLLMVNLMQCWLLSALLSGLVPDVIIDANHITEYLKYAATRNLLAPNSREQVRGQRLSPVQCLVSVLFILSSPRALQSSLKKIMTMLGQVRCRQVDDNPLLETMRPSDTSQVKDFYKAVMIHLQHM